MESPNKKLGNSYSIKKRGGGSNQKNLLSFYQSGSPTISLSYPISPEYFCYGSSPSQRKILGTPARLGLAFLGTHNMSRFPSSLQICSIKSNSFTTLIHYALGFSYRDNFESYDNREKN